MRIWGVLAFAVAMAVGCGSSSNGGGGGGGGSGGTVLSISNLTFSPLDFTVDAGTQVTIKNNDGLEHDVSRQTADNTFTPGTVAGVSFMALVPAASGGSGGPYGGSGGTPGTTSFTIPAGTPSGTVIPYYCNIHKNTMATPNGHITVR